jgi:hypothetical protein
VIYVVHDLFGPRTGGSILAHSYNGSLINALTKVYPDHKWLAWRFKKTSNEFWADPSNRTAFMKWCENELGLKTLEGWYHVSQSQFRSLGGTKLLLMNGGSMIKLLESVYPNHKWLEWKFRKVSDGFWTSHANQLQYMTWLQEELNMQNISDWYAITAKDVTSKGGHRLLLKFHNNIPKLVSTVFKGHEWHEWKFKAVSRGWWRDVSNRKAFMDWAGHQLGVAKPADWLNLTKDDVVRIGGGSMLSSVYAGSVTAALKDVYPSHNWQEPESIGARSSPV